MTGSHAAILDAIDGGLIVSVQASSGSPLRETPIIAAIAIAAVEGGPAGLRINGPADVRAVRALTGLPIIGLHKRHNGTRNVITPELTQAMQLADAGADIIAVDATREVLGDDFSYLSQVARATGLPVMADVSTLDEGLRAWDVGASIVGTTLSGYTPESDTGVVGPDLALVTTLVNAGMRVIGEGRYRAAADVATAFDRGAFAVVVGGAISDPASITASFVRASRRGREQTAG